MFGVCCFDVVNAPDLGRFTGQINVSTCESQMRVATHAKDGTARVDQAEEEDA